MASPQPPLPRTGSAGFFLIGGLAWGLALFGVLQLHRVEGLPAHSICGPWGCGPPTEALLAYHGFWAVLLIPPAMVSGFMLATDHAKNDLAKKLSLGLIAAGSLAIVGILGWATIDWLITSNSSARGYVVQRAFFVLATMVDLPAVQLAASGVACWAAARIATRISTQRQLVTHIPSDPPLLPDATVAESPVSP